MREWEPSKNQFDCHGFEEPDYALFELHGLVIEATRSIKKLNELIRLSGIRQEQLSKVMRESDPNKNATEYKEKQFNRYSKFAAKQYIAVDEYGEIHEVSGLQGFCRAHGLSPSSIYRILNKGKTHKGWTISNV